MSIASWVAAGAMALAGSAHALDTQVRNEHAALHFAGSALIAGVATHYTESRWKGFAIAFGVGVAKEAYDATGWHHTASGKPKDACTLKGLMWDAAGAAVGTYVGGLTITPHEVSYQVAF